MDIKSKGKGVSAPDCIIQEKMKKSFDSIDVAKFIGSILIFAMHCGAFTDYAENISLIPQLLARWGVPFFFICSSYFLFSKSTNGELSGETVFKYIRRIALLYALWLVYNIPNVIYYRFIDNGGKDISKISTWLLFLKDSVVFSTFTGSWYLASSMFSAWFVYKLSKKVSTKTGLGITAIFYLICIFTSSYSGLLPANIFSALKFLYFPINIFSGCFFFFAGKYICENEKAILEKCSQTLSLAGFLLFYGLFLAEICLTRHFKICSSTDFAFSTIFMCSALFLFCLQTDASVKNSLLFRKLSTIIYCCQGNVLLVNGVLKSIFRVPSVLSFVICCFIVACICAAVLYLQAKTKWKWVKYLT